MRENKTQIKLKSGVLELNLTPQLQELVEFGSRINRKRGFLFVSKVLGKHLPTKPSTMQNTYQKLANLIPKEDIPTLFIGFAETATALGQGVFEEANCKDSFYIHSTRFYTSNKLLFSFFEEHCHAPSHLFYMPQDRKLSELLKKVKRVVLVDDEVSTGKTAYNLVTQLQKVLPQVKKFYLLTILNWSKKSYPNFQYLSLYKGEFQFYPNEEMITQKIDSISEPQQIKELDEIIPYNFGRYGVEKLNLKFDINIEELKDKKVLVLGTAEFMYPPYLFAKFLEENGVDVYFQATTRSPVNVDGAIKSKLRFKDNYFENIDNFLYNVIDKSYNKIFICYETAKLPKEFNLKEQLLKKFEVEELFFEI